MKNFEVKSGLIKKIRDIGDKKYYDDLKEDAQKCQVEIDC